METNLGGIVGNEMKGIATQFEIILFTQKIQTMTD